VPGVAYGSQLALGALGVTLIFGILRFANFAHGDVMAFGTMVVLLTTWWFQGMGVGIAPLPTALIALPFGIVGAAAFNLAADRVVFRFYRRRKSPPVILLIASVGVMFALQGIVRFIIGPDDRRLADGARFIIKASEFKAATGLKEGLAIKLSQGLTLAVAAIAVGADWVLWRIKLVRAVAAAHSRALAGEEQLLDDRGTRQGQQHNQR